MAITQARHSDTSVPAAPHPEQDRGWEMLAVRYEGCRGASEPMPCKQTDVAGLGSVIRGWEADINRTDCACRCRSPMLGWPEWEDVFWPALFEVTSNFAMVLVVPGALMPMSDINRSQVSPLVMAFAQISAIWWVVAT